MGRETLLGRRLGRHYDELKWLYCELYEGGIGKFPDGSCGRRHYRIDFFQPAGDVRVSVVYAQALEEVRQCKRVRRYRGLKIITVGKLVFNNTGEIF